MTHTPNLRKPKPPGKVWLNRGKPFYMFVKTGGVFLLHVEFHRLCVTFDLPGVKRWDKQVFLNHGPGGFSRFFLRVRRLVITLDRKPMR